MPAVILLRGSTLLHNQNNRISFVRLSWRTENDRWRQIRALTSYSKRRRRECQRSNCRTRTTCDGEWTKRVSTCEEKISENGKKHLEVCSLVRSLKKNCKVSTVVSLSRQLIAAFQYSMLSRRPHVCVVPHGAEFIHICVFFSQFYLVNPVHVVS